MLQDHIDVRATKQLELSIRLRHRAPWICYKTHQLQRSRDAGILRTTSLGYATEPNNYREADIMVIEKKDININSNSNINNMNLESAHVPRPA